MFSDDPVNVKIGDNLRRVRRTCGMSMNEVSHLIGISPQQMLKYETGRDRISVSTLYRTAQILNAPVAAFFEGLLTGEPLMGKAASSTLEDRATRRSLSRIQDPAVLQSLRALISSLSGEEMGETRPGRL